MFKNRLTRNIFLALVLGVLVGFLTNYYPDNQASAFVLEYAPLLSDIFLQLVKMIIAPLVLSTLIVGVAKLGDIQSVGRIGLKTLMWFVSASFVSLFLGMLLVNFFEPGSHLGLELPASNAETGIEGAAINVKDFIKHVFPKSVFEALAHNEILQIIVFSLFFGIACAASGEKAQPIIRAMDALAEVILKVTGYVMLFAPYAVFGAIAATRTIYFGELCCIYRRVLSEFGYSMGDFVYCCLCGDWQAHHRIGKNDYKSYCIGVFNQQ
jgi:Na+/H+-dicarboxylate symporter